MSEQMQPGRELSRLVAQAIGELRTSHPGFYWQEFATEDGDGGDGFSCPRCGKSVSDPDESTEGDCYKYYSTHIEDAMQAWAWLEENHPWTEQDNAWPWQQGIKAAILLGRDYIGQEDNPRPSVLVMQRADWWSFPHDEIEEGTKEGRCFFIPGDTYPHAIALAVLEAAKETKKK